MIKSSSSWTFRQRNASCTCVPRTDFLVGTTKCTVLHCACPTLILQAVEGAVKILCSYSDFSSAVKRPSLAALLQRPLFPVNGLLEGGRSASETQRSGQQVLLGLSGRSGTGQGRRKRPTVAVSEAVKFSPSGWPPSQQRDQICGWTVI